MTTKNSPIAVLREQAAKIAKLMKGPNFKSKCKPEALSAPGPVVGIAMDDKIIKLTIPWITIEAISEEGLCQYILDLMAENRKTIN